MSAGVRISPSLKKSSICLSPSPSMSKALREQKCLSPSTACAGADELAGAAAHDVGDSPVFSSISRSAAEPQTGQVFGKLVGFGAWRALVEHDLDDLRDDVAGPLHHDRVADPHVLAGDLVLVVQRRVRDDDAADGDGPELGDRRQRAGAPDLDLDRLQHRRRPLGRELVRHRPAGRARDEAEPLLQREIVDLVDDAVDVVAEARALGFDRAVMGEHLRRRLAERRQRIGRQAEALHRMNGLELRPGERLADLAPGVGEELERPRGGDARVELAQRAGGEVARIGEGRLAGLGLAGVQRAKIGVAHVDLAARFEDPLARRSGGSGRRRWCGRWR